MVAVLAPSAWAAADPVPDTVAAMLAAPDAGSMDSVLRARMGKATAPDERQALGQLRHYLDALQAAGKSAELIRQELDRYAREASARDWLLAEARNPVDAAAEAPLPGRPPAALPPPFPSASPASSTPLAIDAATTRAMLARLAAAPDPGAAAVLSSTIGFGAGHFYARQPDRAWIHLGAQAASGAVLVAGLASAEEGQWTPAATAGLSALVLARLVDIALAPGSAHQTAADAFR
ncbi:MAG: hypothetical protein FJ090_09265 [Deltaproteobacteria bacterium]|nr:hypothetical protein [Deltaproteobacteria bacterium]